MRIKIPKNLSVRQINKLISHLANMKEIIIDLSRQVDATLLEDELQTDIEQSFKIVEAEVIQDLRNINKDTIIDDIHVMSLLDNTAKSFDTIITEAYIMGSNQGCRDLDAEELVLTPQDRANIFVLKSHCTNVLDKVMRGLLDKLKVQLEGRTKKEVDIDILQRIVRQQIDGVGLLSDDIKEATGTYPDMEALASYIARLYEKGTRAKNKLIKLLKQQLPTEVVALRLRWVKSFAHKVAKSITRTEIVRAINRGRLVAYKKLNVEMVEVSHPVNQKPCEVCDKYSGKIYEIDKVFDVLPHHPFCSCTWICVIESEK